MPIRILVGLAVGGPSTFGVFIQSDRVDWAKVVKSAGVRVE
jgi:hypothetical protein